MRLQQRRLRAIAVLVQRNGPGVFGAAGEVQAALQQRGSVVADGGDAASYGSAGIGQHARHCCCLAMDARAPARSPALRCTCASA